MNLSKLMRKRIATALPRLRVQVAWGKPLNVLLLLIVFWLLADPEFRVRQWLRSSAAPGAQPSELDSFSKPCIARAVLAQEAERLLGAYACSRDEQAELKVLLDPNQALGGSQRFDCALEAASDTLRQRLVPESSTIGSMQELQKQVEQLQSDLDRKLLVVYSQKGLWNDFLDRYLHLVRTEPQHRAVVNWLGTALVQAQRCGRSAEVEDALDDVIRFHGELKAVAAIKTALEEYKSAGALRARLAAQ